MQDKLRRRIDERIGDRLMNDAMHYAMVKPWHDRADDNSLYGASLELIHAVRKLFASTGIAGVEEVLQRLEAQNEHQAVKAMIAALEEERAVSSVRSGAKYAKAVKDIDSFLARLKRQKQEEQKHMSKKYTKKQIQEAIKHWQHVLESRLDLDDDLEMANAHDVAHINQNLAEFIKVFTNNDLTVQNPVVELVSKALYKSIDVQKLKQHIADLKSLGISSKSFNEAIYSLNSLVHFIKCMDEFYSKTSLDGFEDDVY